MDSVIQKIEFNTKDCKQLTFNMLIQGDSSLKTKIMMQAKIDDQINRLVKKEALILETKIEEMIDDFGIRAGIMFIPKGKYKYVR